MLSHRLGLDLVFALFLVNGLLICAAIATALVTWGSRSEGSGMGVFALATSAIAPSLFAWIVSGIGAFMKPAVRRGGCWEHRWWARRRTDSR